MKAYLLVAAGAGDSGGAGGAGGLSSEVPGDSGNDS